MHNEPQKAKKKSEEAKNEQMIVLVSFFSLSLTVRLFFIDII